jgi:divalent metal cation (Fe/Co/Zn/Cd) transporter
MIPLAATPRSVWVTRGTALTWMTIGYNCVEALVALAAGAVAGSVSLVGFGLDSVIEVSASVTALWRLQHDADPVRRAGAEVRAQRVIAATFLALAAYVLVDAVRALAQGDAAARSPVGVGLAALSLLVMPLLARAKRAVALQLSSNAIGAEARQTSLCAWLSAILLGGLLLNLFWGWWWADPVAALTMTPIIAREGVLTWQGRGCCDHCAPSADAAAGGPRSAA